jgi:transketolase
MLKNIKSEIKEIRKLIIETALNGGRGHIASALSIADFIFYVYKNFNISKKNHKNSDRDIFILSKGHGCLALYSTLYYFNFFKKSELVNFCKFDSNIGGHPEYNHLPGIEATTGALGHGLPIAVGNALGSKLKKLNNYTIVLIGDGELNEGSNWESFLSASKNQLNKLIVCIDRNRLQSYASTQEVLPLYNLKNKLSTFGANVLECDGNNYKEVDKNIKKIKKYKSNFNIIILNTIKGKGLPIIENNNNWHHKSNISNEDKKRLLMEIK